MSVHAHTVYSCFHITVAELISCETPYNLQGLALYQKLANPCLRVLGRASSLENWKSCYLHMEGGKEQVSTLKRPRVVPGTS